MVSEKFPQAKSHGDLERLFEDVYFVTGTARISAPMPMSFSRNMTVVRDNGQLTLINSVRLDDRGLAALNALGDVRHVIRLAGFHGMDDPFYKDHYDAKVWAIEGQKYTKGMDVEPSPDNIYFRADVEMNAGTALPICAAKLFQFKTATPPEGLIILEREGGILISGDCLQNWGQTDRYFSFLARPMMKMMGFIKPYNIGPGWLRFAKPETSEIQDILNLQFEHVLPAHGEEVIGNAKQCYNRTIKALTAPTDAYLT